MGLREGAHNATLIVHTDADDPAARAREVPISLYVLTEAYANTSHLVNSSERPLPVARVGRQAIFSLQARDTDGFVVGHDAVEHLPKLEMVPTPVRSLFWQPWAMMSAMVSKYWYSSCLASRAWTFRSGAARRA